MTTDAQIQANRRNAQHSTGPRTARGKAIASRNNTRHGLCSSSPVIPRAEDPDEWEQHRAETIAGLAPATHLQHVLAERIALILWRLGRVTRYERDVTAQSQQRAPDDLDSIIATRNLGAGDPQHDLAETRASYNEARRLVRALPALDDLDDDLHISDRLARTIAEAVADQLDDFDLSTFPDPTAAVKGLPYNKLTNWTARNLVAFLDAIAQARDADPDELRDYALDAARAEQTRHRAAYDRLRRRVRDLMQERIIPQKRSLDNVIRYEAHLTRQLNQALAHLDRLQHPRPSRPPHPERDGRVEGERRGVACGARDGDDDTEARLAAIGLPLAHVRERGAGGEGSYFCRSNPNSPPPPPGQPQS